MSSNMFIERSETVVETLQAVPVFEAGSSTGVRPSHGDVQVSPSDSKVQLRSKDDEETKSTPAVDVQFVENAEPEIDSEFKLPKISSLSVMILCNIFMQIQFFIIVSSSNAYAEALGGTNTFSGLVIGIPTAFSGLALIPLSRYDNDRYKIPLHFACGTMIIGNILYGLAYRTHFLYLLLLGRMVQGFGFTMFMYSKRYCSDPRLVGVRRRTSLAGWLVLGQGIGMSLGPFIGGLISKVGLENAIFNGYTGPAWLMCVVWVAFWIYASVLFEDVTEPIRSESYPMNSPQSTRSGSIADTSMLRFLTLLSPQQWGVAVCMCWFAMTCFFILGAWESNIPVFGSSSISPFHWSPFAAGNFIALGGIATFPFLILNLLLSRRTQDRHILALGSALGLTGLLIALAILRAHKVHFGGYFVSWFLVALGFNLASTCTLSLLSKQLPNSWNGKISMGIQYSNYTGRVTGAIWGGAGVKVGMLNYIGLQLAIIGIGTFMFTTLWRNLKAKTG